VKVTTPLTFDGPLAAEMMELPPFLASVTVLPLTRLLFASLSVTVMVEVVEPSATTEVGLALTVELPAVAGPALKTTVPSVLDTGVTMDSVLVSAVVDDKVQVETPEALLREQAP